MRNLLLTIGLIAAACLASVPLRAQDAGPVGFWTATWASAVRHERDGSITVQKTSTATLRLQASGDSLTGTWTTTFDGGQVWLVSGRYRDGVLRLVSTAMRSGELPGDGVVTLTRQEWSGALTGDHIEGEHWLVLDTPSGQRRSGPRPWSAERAKESAAG